MIQNSRTILKKKLDYHYRAFDKSRISPDPLQFLHLFSDKKDIEVMGFIASVFAYGNVNQINNVLNSFLKLSDHKPYRFILDFSEDNEIINIEFLRHRFFTSGDIKKLFLILKHVYQTFGSLYKLFILNFKNSDPDIKNALNFFNNYMINTAARLNGDKPLSSGLKFMFPLPGNGSACKRSNLFLRWMVRKDELDFGIWKAIPPDRLIIPVDTHIARICKELKLTRRKTVSWKMAKEITLNLKSFDPEDPVKYDFAICHIGMRKMKF